MEYKLTSPYSPMGDQPEAIRQLVDGVEHGAPAQTLLGVTGSGKTFTMANVIARTGRPTLILSHNKTLAAQLYSEMKAFFPENAVQYFVSYYDYYQPEAYLPSTDTYIEKDLAINAELDQLRLATTNALLSGRRDVVVVSSVSCLYGIGNPEDFHAQSIHLRRGDLLKRDLLLRALVDAQYTRNEVALQRGNFRCKGDTVDVFLASTDSLLRISFWGDEVEEIETLDILTGQHQASYDEYVITPANIFVTTRERINTAIDQIALDLGKQVAFFEAEGKEIEAARIRERVTYDMEMIKEVGHCSGIENYSRYFDGRAPGTRPFCLLDYFPEDFLVIIDESHVTLPQIQAMSGGDFKRKQNLVDYGFRLPSAIDNRPLKFSEFEALTPHVIYVSATPADYELKRSDGVVAEQLIRPTGLLDPVIEVRPTKHQVDDLMEEIQKTIEAGERTLVTTLTKRMAEELDAYFHENNIRSAYIHSDVDTLDRVHIMDALRDGEFDVLIGVNLLREGLDLPEVSLVAILDADKEGFLRNTRSLTQTAGRAARNVHGHVIMYADRVTDSMKRTIDETARRRAKQEAYNKEHHITPTQIVKPRKSLLDSEELTDTRSQFGNAGGASGASKGSFGGASKGSFGGTSKGSGSSKAYREAETHSKVASAEATYESIPALEAEMARAKERMLAAAKALDFMEAAQQRDYMLSLEERIERLKKSK
jgi:excinuclease ABC subunit B